MNNLFICTTQYQLFNIINIINSYYVNEENNLIILGCISGLKQRLSNIASRTNLFSRIVKLDAGKIDSSLGGYLKSFIYIIHPGVFSNFIADRVFITGTEIYSRIIAFNCIKKNANTSLYYYEDGMASYTDVIDSLAYNRSNKILKTKYGFYLIQKCQGLFVYKPEFVISNPSNIELFRIPSVITGSDYAKKLMTYFDRDDNTKADKKFIFFDAFFQDTTDIANTKIIVSYITKILGSSLIVKPHPSCISKWEEDNIDIFKTTCSFEVFLLNHSFKRNVLLSAFSTACLLPKIVFDEEPIVILLYELYDNYPTKWRNGDLVYKRIQKYYLNQDFFLIPKSFQELNNILKKFL